VPPSLLTQDQGPESDGRGGFPRWVPVELPQAAYHMPTVADATFDQGRRRATRESVGRGLRGSGGFPRRSRQAWIDGGGFPTARGEG